MSNEFKSRISGIPCLVSIDSYYRGSSDWYDRMYGWQPGDVEEIEWSILDRKGYPAPWLEKKLTEKDRNRIDHECHLFIEEV